jgi:putative endonuclease
MRFFYLIIALCYFIYILFSKALNKYYVGSTSNIDERLKKHLSNHKGYTSMAKDWEIVYTESFDDRTSALVREKQIKRWKSRKMIEHLIKEKE